MKKKATKAETFAKSISEQISELDAAQTIAEGVGILPVPVKKVTLQRVKGADSESITLEIDQVKWVNPATLAGRSIVLLVSGHRIEVLGTVDEVNQKIEDAI